MADAAQRGLSERLAAEQDERRRLAELLHDGPVQHLAALGQMLDAATHALAGGETEAAARIVERSLEVAREATRDLRELLEGVEPRTLHEDGFAAAVGLLADRLAARRGIRVAVDVAAGDRLGENARTGLYQIVREALDQAVRRGPPSRLQVTLHETGPGGAELVVFDDGVAERRQAVIDGLQERARTLDAELAVERTDAGTTLRVLVPPVLARR